MAVDYSRLKVIPLFASLKKADLEYLGGILKEDFCPAGQPILKQGDPGDKFFIIVDGEVGIIREYGPAVRVGMSTLKKYSFFGESGLLQDEPRNATIEAIADTTYFYIEKAQFDDVLARLPSVKAQIKDASIRRSKGIRLQSLKGLDSDEVALWVAHRDFVPLVWRSLFGLIVGNGLAIALAALAFFSASAWSKRWPASPYILGASAVVVFTVLWIWYVVDWTNDYLVLTNRRVIYREVFGFLREIRQEIPIEAVQSVSVDVGGPIFKILGLADITITTIGGKLKFEYLRDAEDLKDRILGRRDMLKLEAKSVERNTISQELGRALGLVPPTRRGAWDILPAVQPKPTLLERLRASRQMRLEKTGEITWRRHWWFLVKRMIGPFVCFLGVVAALVLKLLVAPDISLPSWWLLFFLLGMVLISLWVWWEYAVWGGDIYTLTDDRVIDIENYPLGLRGEKRRDGPLDRIQDIDVDIPNVLARFLNMGNVKIKTGAAGSDITFYGVADPYSVQRDVFHRLAKRRRKEEERQRSQRFQEMITWLTMYERTTAGASQSGTEETQTGG